MLLDLSLFVLLAVLTNTAFPAPFDPVLVCFAVRYSLPGAYLFALVGGLCAGIAGVIDARVMARIGGKIPWRWARLLPTCRGRWFYLAVMLAALVPGTFGAVRMALVRRKPDPTWYALSLMAGRLPRYVLTIHFAQLLALPAWIPALFVAAAMVFALAVRNRRPRDLPLQDLRPA